MEYSVTLVIFVAIATTAFRPISGQGWTYQSIGEGWQSDSATEEEPESVDYRFTSYKSMLSSGALFRDPDLVSFVQLVVDETREQLLVGGRDVLFRLNLDTLTQLEREDWASGPDVVTGCQDRGQAEDTCHNFVRVLILQDDSVFTCGTNSFNPNCTTRDANDLSNITSLKNGQGICPYSPSYNATAIMTSEGDLYAATVIDFSARDPVITRRSDKSALRTMKQDSKWLNEPNFVSAYEIKNFVYFFFRETAVEYINCGKKVYSRVARVCKNDKGGSFALEHIWTSYHKARLNCSLPGNFPFYFDELQSTFYSEDEHLIYAVFTTPSNSIPGSAVCVYDLSALTEAFDGSFKHQDGPSAAWLTNQNDFVHGRCEKQSTSTKRSSEHSTDLFVAAKKYQLMDKAVSMRDKGPLIMRESERWTHIVVDLVATKNHIYDVLFLATEDGKVRKMIRFPGTDKTCLIEEIKIVANGHPRPVTNMKMASSKSAIYISTEGEIIKVPVQRCYRFHSNTTCINAQDPYCGWDTKLNACTPPPKNNVHSGHWEQDFRHCPILDTPIEGGWSTWSSWSQCQNVGPDKTIGHCLCRSRSCDRPKPANKGPICKGQPMEVTNCTVNGGWTDWSEWSACSQSCGFAMKYRTRSCNNPSPKFGGSDCPTGPVRDQVYCTDNPECPVVPVDGHWSSWSGWSTCTTNCNSGIQTRKRSCDRPPPDRGGHLCVGNKEEWRMCNTHKCLEISKTSPWTDWIQTNHTKGGYFEQRFRFTCRANVETSKDIKTSFAKSQAQFCFNDSQCYKSGEISDSITSIDTFTAVDRVLKKYCRSRRKLFKKYCNCKSLGVFLVCQKCGFG